MKTTDKIQLAIVSAMREARFNVVAASWFGFTSLYWQTDLIFRISLCLLNSIPIIYYFYVNLNKLDNE